jgi:hypothetical protein
MHCSVLKGSQRKCHQPSQKQVKPTLKIYAAETGKTFEKLILM